MDEETDGAEPIPEPWNVRLPRGFYARVATTDEVTWDERDAIQRAAAAAGNAILALRREVPKVLDDLIADRAPEEVAYEMDQVARAEALSREQKTELTRQSRGQGTYAQASAREREEARIRLELDTRHKDLPEEDRAEAAEFLSAVAEARLGQASEFALARLDPQHRKAIRYAQHVRVWAMTDAKGEPSPLPATVEEVGKIPETTADAILTAAQLVDLGQLNVERSPRDLDSRNPDRLKAPGGD